MRSIFRRAGLLAAFVLIPGCSGSTPDPAPPAAPATSPAPEAATASAAVVTPTSAAGAFTADQATSGGEVFEAKCAECHGMRDVRGSDFMFNWEGSSVGRLYREISRTMPEDDPGSLPTEDYLAVVAYILSLNDFPAGETALTADPARLDALRIER